MKNLGKHKASTASARDGLASCFVLSASQLGWAWCLDWIFVEVAVCVFPGLNYQAPQNVVAYVALLD